MEMKLCTKIGIHDRSCKSYYTILVDNKKQPQVIHYDRTIKCANYIGKAYTPSDKTLNTYATNRWYQHYKIVNNNKQLQAIKTSKWCLCL